MSIIRKPLKALAIPMAFLPFNSVGGLGNWNGVVNTVVVS